MSLQKSEGKTLSTHFKPQVVTSVLKKHYQYTRPNRNLLVEKRHSAAANDSQLAAYA